MASKSYQMMRYQVRVFSYLDLDDEIIELSITPSRCSALSMRGWHLQVATIYDKAVNFKDFTLSETD